MSRCRSDFRSEFRSDFRRGRQRGIRGHRMLDRRADALQARSRGLQPGQDFGLLFGGEIGTIQLREQFFDPYADSGRFSVDGRERRLEVFKFCHDLSPEGGERREDGSVTPVDFVVQRPVDGPVHRVANGTANHRTHVPVKQHAEMI